MHHGYTHSTGPPFPFHFTLLSVLFTTNPTTTTTHNKQGMACPHRPLRYRTITGPVLLLLCLRGRRALLLYQQRGRARGDRHPQRRHAAAAAATAGGGGGERGIDGAAGAGLPLLSGIPADARAAVGVVGGGRWGEEKLDNRERD